MERNFLEIKHEFSDDEAFTMVGAPKKHLCIIQKAPFFCGVGSIFMYSPIWIEFEVLLCTDPTFDPDFHLLKDCVVAVIES